MMCRTGPILTGLCLLAFGAALAGAPALAQSSSSVFPDPNASSGGVTVRPASSSPSSVFPDPNAGSSGSGGNTSVFPDPNGAQRSAPAASPFPTPGGAGGFSQPPSGGFSQPPQQQAGPGPAQQACIQEFTVLREARDNRGKAIQTAMKSKNKPGADVACKLFRSFSAAEAKMLNFLKSESRRCGIPPDLSKQLAQGHAQTTKTTEQVCTAAAQPRAPAGPRLSDVLGAPSLPTATQETRSGGSTFDTINGNVLAR